MGYLWLDGVEICLSRWFWPQQNLEAGNIKSDNFNRWGLWRSREGRGALEWDKKGEHEIMFEG